MIDQQERQAIIDDEHLKLLAVGHWISAGFWGAYGLFMVAYFGFFGIVFASIPTSGTDAPPTELRWVFLVMAAAVLAVVTVLVVFKVMAGVWLRKRKNRIAAMVAAGISCLEMPYGTALGVLTLITLARPSVAAMFAPPAAALPVEPSGSSDTIAE